MIGPFMFLDIDGVLNRHNAHANGYCGCDADCVAVLNRILDATGAKIILVSAWRYFVLRGEMTIAGINGLLCTHGVKWGSVVDVLPEDIPDGMGNANRGEAVHRWFRSRFCLSHKTPYIVIDDMDLGYCKNGLRLLRTEPNQGLAGLGSNDIEMVISVLKGKD